MMGLIQPILILPEKTKEQTSKSVLNVLKMITEISNTNLVKNADGLLNNKPIDTEVEWIGKNKSQIPQNKFKVTY